MAKDLISLLMLEDDYDDALLIQEALEQSVEYEFKIQHVDRVRAAIDHLATTSCDAILADMFLPDGSGLDVLKALTDLVPTTPIVMLTGLRDESVGRLAVSKGADDYISKADMRPNRLTQIIIHSIERRRRMNQVVTA